MRMVTAILRTISLERVVNHLEKIGIRGLTISEVKGIGEEVRLNNAYAIHNKIEIIVPDHAADDVVQTILNTASSGLVGDGIAFVASLDYAVKLRTGEKMT